ncbi:MAG: response regulator [Bryobacterales bacterium]|nr:response regulator [Bryobacterales bacterium]
MSTDSLSREIAKLATVLVGAGVPPRRVLVAETDSVHRTVIGRLLERLGHEPELAADQEQAIRLAQSKHFDIILADIRMERFLETLRLGDNVASVVLLCDSDNGDSGFLERPVTAQKLIEWMEDAERNRPRP